MVMANNDFFSPSVSISAVRFLYREILYLRESTTGDLSVLVVKSYDLSVRSAGFDLVVSIALKKSKRLLNLCSKDSKHIWLSV